MSFLSRFWREFTARIRSTGARRDLPLTRFIFSSKHLSRTKGLVKAGAFMPRGGALSVFRTDSLGQDDIWAIGRGVRPSRTLHARADLSSGTLQAVSDKLVLELDESPPRHGNIKGWPPDPEKDAQKALALELAARSDLRIPPRV